MSDQDVKPEKDEWELFLENQKPKTRDEIEVEKHFPNLPNHILKDYTAEQWLWFSDFEKANLIKYGQPNIGSLDPWSNFGG